MIGKERNYVGRVPFRSALFGLAFTAFLFRNCFILVIYQILNIKWCLPEQHILV